MQYWCWNCRKMRALSNGFSWLPAYCPWSRTAENPTPLLVRYWLSPVCWIEQWIWKERTHMFWWYFFLELARWYCRWKLTACETFIIRLLFRWIYGRNGLVVMIHQNTYQKIGGVCRYRKKLSFEQVMRLITFGLAMLGPKLRYWDYLIRKNVKF